MREFIINVTRRKHDAIRIKYDGEHPETGENMIVQTREHPTIDGAWGELWEVFYDNRAKDGVGPCAT